MRLTSNRLQALFYYNSVDGTFTRLIKAAGNALVGQKAGCLANTGYLVIRVDGKLYLAHRLAWLYIYGEWPRCGLDHKNMIRTDNRIDNLREATSSQNKANKRKSLYNTSGYKGVSWSSARQQWFAQIKISGRTKFLGYFDDPQEAHEVYCRAAVAAFGEFARSA